MKWVSTLALLCLAAMVCIAGSLFVGASESIRPGDVWNWMLDTLSGNGSSDNWSLVRAVVYDVRLPRVLLCFLVGSSLAVSGTALQAMFRNPLVCPYILGLSSGAAFGAALGLASAWLPVQPLAFIGGIIAAALSYGLARAGKHVPAVALVLSGVIVGGVFTAALAVVQFTTDPFRLQSIVHWTMGNMHNATWTKLHSSWYLMTGSIIMLVLFRWRLNVLALGDEEARAVGMNPAREKIMLLIPATLACSAAVAVAGVIGLFGLIVPHIVRMILGPDNRKTVPGSVLFGGMLLLIVDDFSRSITSFEIPIGVFTTFLCAPFFIFLIRRFHIGWES